MKALGFALLFLLIGCVEDSHESIEKYKQESTVNIKVLKLQTIEGDKYFVIDENKNSYRLSDGDYVRLERGDSVKLSTITYYSKILEIHKK